MQNPAAEQCGGVHFRMCPPLSGELLGLVVFLTYLRGGKSGRLLGVGPLDNERGVNEGCHLSAELRVFVLWTRFSLNDPVSPGADHPGHYGPVPK